MKTTDRVHHTSTRTSCWPGRAREPGRVLLAQDPAPTSVTAARGVQDAAWTLSPAVRIRLVARARRYGVQPVNTACSRALELDVINVTKITSMLEKGTREHP